MPRAVDVVRRVARRAKSRYLAAFENGDALLIAHGITTPDRLAHFLAQILHESGGLELEWENMNYRAERLLQVFGVGRHSAAITPGEAQALARKPKAIAERVYGLGNPRKAQALGNTQPGDGFRYRGGGLLQTTGRDNYRRMGQRCGVDFKSRPDLVVSAEHALKPALGEWTEAKLNAFADCNDILSISRAINIGSARATAVPNGMEDRLAWFAKVRPLIGRVEFVATAAEPKETFRCNLRRRRKARRNRAWPTSSPAASCGSAIGEAMSGRCSARSLASDTICRGPAIMAPTPRPPSPISRPGMGSKWMEKSARQPPRRSRLRRRRARPPRRRPTWRLAARVRFHLRRRRLRHQHPPLHLRHRRRSPLVSEIAPCGSGMPATSSGRVRLPSPVSATT